MKYTLILAAEEGSSPDIGSADWASYAEEFGAWNKEASEAGVHRGGEPVEPPTTATTLRMGDSKIEMHDGPFAETKECIIGWYLLECEDLDEVLKWAAKLPLVARGYGAVEVRPVTDFSKMQN